MSPATGRAEKPSREAYAAAAWLLACDPLMLEAFGLVEAGSEGAFLDTGEPTILFERHVFSALTGGRFDGFVVPGTDPVDAASWRVISSPKPGGYGPVSVQHRRLNAAVALDRNAALKSASWGLFQILGRNHAACGYPDVQRFVNAMIRSVDDHLRALTMFIRFDTRLLDAIRKNDYVTAAEIYNGPRQADHDYAGRLRNQHVALRERCA